MVSILEFKTSEEAVDMNRKIWLFKLLKAQKAGYGVKDGLIYGKNAKTGLIMWNKQHTDVWEEVKVSPEGTYYIKDKTALTVAYFGIKEVLGLYLKRKVTPLSWKDQKVIYLKDVSKRGSSIKKATKKTT